ncbi:hypothetical protein RBSH_04418 [Rhodopirellula baltica SH28]|uniref:Uncharacterized protein n=1 Tax=Rhodopirellula baltica SH28 TaxID=993517 RepID=K5DCW6_RHOBT|nr:hypothetical protein RBSH_04418 [Rhodopirellula baltica SH28]
MKKAEKSGRKNELPPGHQIFQFRRGDASSPKMTRPVRVGMICKPKAYQMARIEETALASNYAVPTKDFTSAGRSIRIACFVDFESQQKLSA